MFRSSSARSRDEKADRRITIRLGTALIVVLGMLIGPIAIAASAATTPHATTPVMGSYVSVTPFRITDTRSNSGQPNAGKFLAANSTLNVQVTTVGTAPVPAGTAAVVLNVTAVDPTASGFLTVFPEGITMPVVSNLNFPPGLTVANLVTVPLSSSGMVSIYNHAGSTNVVVDVEGYYTSAPLANDSGLYNSLSPVRVLGTLASGTAIGPNTSTPVTVTGTATGVPANATAVVVNTTAAHGTATSFLTVYPAGVTRPTASNVDFMADHVVGNRVTVGVGTYGRIEIYNHTGTVKVDVDVDGYYTGSGGTGSAFVPITPVRITDTRVPNNGTPIPANTSEEFNLSTTASGIPTAALAVAGNFAVVAGDAPGYLTVYPKSDTTVPVASDVNWAANQFPAVANFTVADTAGTGSVKVYNSHGATINVVIDAFGYFVRQLPTSTTVSESPTSVTYGHESASVFYVTVTAQYGQAVPNGETVPVQVGSVTCTVILKGGKGHCTIANTALADGSYPVSATYGGDASLIGSSGASGSKLTVYKDATGTSVWESATSVTYGHETASVFHVTVTTHYGEAVPYGETVTVSVGSATCKAGLSSGKGTCTIANTALAVGTYDVSAAYGGDASLSGSSGASGSKLTVGKDASSTTVSESPTSVTYGDESASVFSASVTTHYGEAVPYGETVTVSVGSATCKAVLSSGKGTCTIANSALPVGTYDVSAAYGDANLSNSSGTSSSKLTVGKDASATTVSESPTSVTYGDESASVFSANVTTHYGEAVPDSETVTVSVGSATCTATLKSGKGTCTIANSALAVGSYDVSATYGGDANLSNSSGTSSSKLTVGKDASATTVSESPTSVTYGDESASVFSASVTTHYGEAVPDSETVQVQVGSATCTAALKGGKGTCTIANSALAVGSYDVSAAYGGDANLADSSGTSGSKLTV